jgi:acetyl-CoA C-acetyltransferase
MAGYLAQYNPPRAALAQFAVNAHDNARNNENALFRDKEVTAASVLESRLITPPVRLLDCAPICEGAAAVVLAPTADARAYCDAPVRLLASEVATDRFRLADRADPLYLTAAATSAARAFGRAGVGRADVSFVEPHDAFTIMTCLLLEAAGFAARGAGWRLAAEGEIRLEGRLPLTTMGGLKARGHPIGATGVYQVCEIVLQLTGRAGANQLNDADVALMQSVGGVAATVITHIIAV